MAGISSLTSESTMSSVSEFNTPPNSLISSYFGKGPIRSPGADSSRAISLSPGTTSPWSSVENKEIPRNKSFSFEASKSPRPRSSRRKTCSERSLNSCSSNGISPASMFLSSFGKSSRRPSIQQVSPDDEGQEVGSYVLGKEIGHGGFSTVKEAFTFSEGREVKHAVKIVRKRIHSDDAENDRVQAELDHEISLWRYMHHPHIVSLISVFDTPFATFAFMQLNEDGSLFDLMKQPANRRGLAAKQAQRYTFQLACALRYLHEDMRIVHRDVKLENCLLDNPSADGGAHLLLCDFGLAKFIKNPHDSDSDSDSRPSTPHTADAASYCITGSLPYSSPETIQSPTEDPSPAADVWALGVVLFTMLTGSLPFSHSLQPKLAAMIVDGSFDVNALRQCWGLNEVGKTQMEMAVQVVKGCLTVNPERRWNIQDVLEAAWFEGVEE
ncbi:kinase-like domain-containing protein [Tricharina praecox]|uniref:kinase-like domain-containing protein n=1 Tax=Tricharina praecox TaxID=43433 RepID=UPI00221F3B53|nr:kinase-like domain-containing protein [Tricharina praecox]KAI5843674.1 kinase-like domain-containing protein [Tricharina praecox]